ncbi:MAG: PQQ-dependent sugar dehydrogenase, partial [Cryobacterium sp.]|nr:PQQ-dependent sugar dehydrogenase [Cryobacterium sp.]
LSGGVPDDNPFSGSLVWSMGHRNPQGIAWDSTGQLWAAEFGQDTWDELNVIFPGANYGWPNVEGAGGDARYRDPVVVWSTAEASPSGLAVAGDSLFLAALRGQRVWAVYTAVDPNGTVTQQPDAVPWFTGELGRIRDLVVAPNGNLWMLTNNTDGRGSPRSGDDRLIEVELQERG